MRSVNRLISKLSQITKVDPSIHPFVEMPEEYSSEIQAHVLQCPEVLLRKRVQGMNGRLAKYEQTGPGTYCTVLCCAVLN